MNRLQNTTLFLAFILSIISFAAKASDNSAKDSYRFSFPPLVAVHAANAEDLYKAVESPAGYAIKPQRLLRVWKEAGGIGELDAVKFFSALKNKKATAINLIVQPPPLKPYRYIFSAKTKGLEDVNTRTAFLRSCGAGEDSKIVHAYDNGRLIIASDKTTLKNFINGDGIPSDGSERWRASLHTALTSRQPGISLWADGEWLMGLAAIKGVFLREKLSQNNWPLPVAAYITISHEKEIVDCSVKILSKNATHIDSPEKATFSSVISGKIFPADSRAVLSVNLKQLSATCGFDAGVKNSWQAILKTTSLFSAESGSWLSVRMSALRMLTGLHPDYDFLRLFSDEVSFAIWKNAAHNFQWAFFGETVDKNSATERIKRAVSWASYFDRQHGSAKQAELQDEKDGNKFAQFHYTPGEFVLCALPENIILGKNRKTVDRLLLRSGLGEAKAVPSENILSWKFIYPASSFSGSRSWIGRFPVSDAKTISEEGYIKAANGYLEIRTCGKASPLCLSLAVIDLAQIIVENFSSSHSEMEMFAHARLRQFVDAQQVYSHLGLAAFNNRKSGFAPTLSDLINGKSENGSSLSTFYDKLYTSDEMKEMGLTFSRVAGYLAQGGAIDGYKYVSIKTRGGKALDHTKEWAMKAIPLDIGRHAILLVTQDGKVYRQTVVTPETAYSSDIPEKLSETEWSEVR